MRASKTHFLLYSIFVDRNQTITNYLLLSKVFLINTALARHLLLA